MSTTHTAQATTGVIEQGDPAADPRAFRRTLGQFATGVTVISTSDGTRHVGMAVNSFAAVSLDPPLVSWSIRRESRNRDFFLGNGHFAISILADDQFETSALFGRPQEDQFDNVEWTAGILGDRLLDNAIAHLECTLEAFHEGGDHLILIGRVVRSSRSIGLPLLFSQGQYGIAEAHPQLEMTSASPTPRPSAAGDVSLFMSLLKTTEQRMSVMFDEHRERLGINMAGSRIVNLLVVNPASPRELAERALLGEAAVEDTLTEFTDRGWVTPSADQTYALTDTGRSLGNDLLRSAQEFTAERLEGIAESDIAAARRVLIGLLTSGS